MLQKNKSLFLAFTAVSISLIFIFASEDFQKKAVELNQNSLVIDFHCDTLQYVLMRGKDLSKRGETGAVDIPRLKEGGVNTQVFAAWVDSIFKGPFATKRALKLIDAMYEVLEKNPNSLELVLNSSDVERLARNNKIGALLGIEGGHALDGDIRILRNFHRLGVRLITLTWSNSNEIGDSSDDKPIHNGLSEFGKSVVKEMNRLGMIIDLSHASDKTFWDVLGITKKPVVASHSNCRSIVKVPRNLTDDMIKAIAKNGGVIGINFYSGFVDDEFNKKYIEWRKSQPPRERKAFKDPEKWAEYKFSFFETPLPIQGPPLESLSKHIDHIYKLVGPDHIGLGSDFDGIDSAPVGLEDVSKLPNLTEALLKRGYTEKEIKKILGENFLRVIKKVTEK